MPQCWYQVADISTGATELTSLKCFEGSRSDRDHPKPRIRLVSWQGRAGSGGGRGVFGVGVERITDAQENYERGDFLAPSGATIECKGQPIDPARYKQNFVEIFEVTENERHRDGFTTVAELLGIDLVRAERIPVRIKGRGVPTPLGRPDFISVSIRSMAASGWTIYVNHVGGHVYLYSSDEIMEHLRSTAPLGLARGAGRSNEDTFESARVSCGLVYL